MVTTGSEIERVTSPHPDASQYHANIYANISQYQTNSCQYLNQYHPIIKCEMPISCQYICQYQPIVNLFNILKLGKKRR